MSTRLHISQPLRAVSWLNDEQRENSWWICWSKSSLITLNIALAQIATHSSTLAWQIPWTEEPGRLQSMGWLGVRHDWATSLSLFTFNPLQCSCLENSRDRGAWWAAVYGVTQSRTRLKQLSSSSSSTVIINSPIVWTNWNLTKWCHLNRFTPAQLQATLIPNVNVRFHFRVIWVTTWKGLFSCWLLSAAITWNALYSKWTLCILLTYHTGNCFLVTLKHSNEDLQEVSFYLWKVSQWCKGC